MHMVIMVFRTSMADDVLSLLEAVHLPYTRLDGAQGKGETGRAPGSVVWGGANTVVFMAVPDHRLEELRERVSQFVGTLKERQTVGVPFHVFVSPCIQWL